MENWGVPGAVFSVGWRRRGQTQRKLEDVRQKQVRKGGPRVRASVRDAGRGRVHLCGPRAGYWRPASLEGGRGCSCQSPARGVGTGGPGGRWSRPGQSPGAPARLSPPWSSTSPPRSVCTTRAVGRGQVGVGSPGGKLEGSTLRPVPPRHPATAGRSFRARGASPGAAMLASSQRTWGG